LIELIGLGKLIAPLKSAALVFFEEFNRVKVDWVDRID